MNNQIIEAKKEIEGHTGKEYFVDGHTFNDPFPANFPNGYPDSYSAAPNFLEDRFN